MGFKLTGQTNPVQLFDNGLTPQNPTIFIPASFNFPSDPSLQTLKRKSKVTERMSAYENVVGGKLKLKGKALDVKAGGMKKKKKSKKQYDQSSQIIEHGFSEGQLTDPNLEDEHDPTKLNEEGSSANIDDALTPAEKRYIEQRERIDSHRLAKISNKSHRDRIQDFNQYLANMSEHYDIPKVGPG